MKVLIASAVGHLLLLWWMREPEWKRQSAPQVVRLTIVEPKQKPTLEPKVAPRSATPKAKAVKTAKAPPAVKAPDTQQTPDGVVVPDLSAKLADGSLRYGDLFPGAVEQIDKGESGHGDGAGPASTHAQIAAEQLAGKVDVPLIYRQKNPEAKAVAMLKRRPQGDWLFASVDGDPHLRAVLYESLSEPRNEGAVQDLFARVGPQVTIVLLQRAINGRGGASETIQLRGARLTIEKRFTGTGVSMAAPADGVSALMSMTIPDEEAERARRRDRSALAALERSPAYHSPIRNRFPRRGDKFSDEQG